LKLEKQHLLSVFATDTLFLSYLANRDVSRMLNKLVNDCIWLQGAGVLKADKVRMNQVRHATNKVQSMLSGSAAMYDTQWQVSNR
jgi:hypothetical protein